MTAHAKHSTSSLDFSQGTDTLLSMTDQSLPDAAVAAALAQDWKEAISINTAILKGQKEDIGALCRLGYALMQDGQSSQAKKIFEKILAIDQYNQIAQKNLKKLGSVKKKNGETASMTALSPLMFLEEPGITKIVDCIHVAPPAILSGMFAGQEVVMKAKNHCVEIRTAGNTYLGALPDDISFKLIKYLDAGNTYRAIVKSVEKNFLKVLIREISRGKRFASQPSFTANTSYVPFSRGTKDTGEGPDMTPTGEENDVAEEPEN